MLEPKVQRVSLADFCRVVTFYSLCACSCGNGGSIVSTIIRYNKQPIAGLQLGLEVFESRYNTHTFIVGWYKYGNTLPNRVFRMERNFLCGQDEGCNDLENKHGHGNGQQDGQ